MAEETAKTKYLNRGSEEKTFQPGDLAVYPAHGVGRIEAIEHRQIDDVSQDFYVMRILENKMLIMIPVQNLASVGLRHIIQSNKIDTIYNLLKERPDSSTDRQSWNKRQKAYTEKLKSGSLYDVAEVFRDLYILKFEKDLTIGERKIFETAQSLLIQEISVARSEEQNAILSEIERLFEI